MTIELSNEAKMNLERQHKLVRDGRIKDRIKAVLLHCELAHRLTLHKP